MKKFFLYSVIGIFSILAIGCETLSTQNKTSNTTGGNVTANAANKPKTNNAPSQLWLNAPQGAEPAWTKGPANAPVTLEEFSDFECPACASMAPILRDMQTAYGNQVRIVFRQYPLTQIHQKAIEASRATEAAGSQGKFWEMHDLIYANQATWKKDADVRVTFAEYAKNLGLNVEKFKADVSSPMIDSRISLDLKRGDAVQVRSTPTIFLNGRLLGVDEMSADGLRKAIDAAIREKGEQMSQVSTSTSANSSNSASSANVTKPSNTAKSSNVAGK